MDLFQKKSLHFGGTKLGGEYTVFAKAMAPCPRGKLKHKIGSHHLDRNPLDYIHKAY